MIYTSGPSNIHYKSDLIIALKSIQMIGCGLSINLTAATACSMSQDGGHCRTN